MVYGMEDYSNYSQLKFKIMRSKQLLLPVIAMLWLLMGGCKKNMDAPNASLVDISSNMSSAKLLPPPNLAAVNLGMAGNFVILSKSGITDVSASAITGDIGTSPITGAAIHVPCTEVTGTIYSVDAAGPLPCRVTSAGRLKSAVLDMQAAYTDAAGRATSTATSAQAYMNVGGGTLTGLTFTPGVYTWTSAVTITGDITINGSSTDVWIFQVAQTLTMGTSLTIHLTGGAKASNIFWQVAEGVTLGTTSHFEGIILGKTLIALNTGASINGRTLAQTAVTLQQNAVTQPPVTKGH